MSGTISCAVCAKTGGSLSRCGRCQSRVYCGKFCTLHGSPSNAGYIFAHTRLVGSECQKKDWPTHKSDCKRQNYLLKVDLHPRYITNPRITRTLSCPATSTFAQLHEALQIAFGWAGTHLYDFEVFDHAETLGRENRFTAGPEPILKITDLATDEDTMHASWMPEPAPKRDSAKTKLFSILDGPTTAGKTIHYMYDFGDGWEHVVVCTGRAPPTELFSCIDGEGHECAEDVGGWKGWLQLLDDFAQNCPDDDDDDDDDDDADDDFYNPTKEQFTRMCWYEDECSNGQKSGLGGKANWEWDKDAINTRLGHRAHGIPPHARARPVGSIALLSLEKESWLDEMYADFLGPLRATDCITEITELGAAMHLLSGRRGLSYETVVVTDAAVVKREFRDVCTVLETYVRLGGKLILGLHLPSFATPPDLDRFFKKTFGLDWKVAQYHRSTFSVNRQHHGDFRPETKQLFAALEDEYSMKALQLSGVKREDQVYLAEPDYGDDCPAAFTRYHGGYLGYVGDVNTEEGTTKLLLALCGL